MQEPPELEPVVRPERDEGPSGTKEDLGISEWAETEFGGYWWGQTDEQLRQRPIMAQTEDMRESGEFMHWYQVMPVDKGLAPRHMSGRTGPEACVKVERMTEKGWAQSWKYVCPDSHRGPYFDYAVTLTDGLRIGAVGRSDNDAISMVESEWGPGHVLCVERLSRTDNNHLVSWIKHWRTFMRGTHERVLEKRAVSLPRPARGK